MSEFRITEIFKSVQGESSYAGMPCAFIRLTGCPLRCRWCDTVYSFHGGTTMTTAEILAKLQEFGVPLVELTGGEPLAQPGVTGLMAEIIAAGYKVLIETSGAESIAEVPREATIIMDLKCPGSGMHERNLWENIEHLKPTDEIKFVIASREDFEWMEGVIKEHDLQTKCRLLVSPAWGLVTPENTVNWMLDAGLNARLNLQIHKYIWNPRKRGV